MQAFPDAAARSARADQPPDNPLSPPPLSFEELYATHFTSLAVQLFAYFGDRQEAQDVVQEAFCRALARWPRLARYDDPVAWVRRVAWNLATSRWRKTRTAGAGPYVEGAMSGTTHRPGTYRVALSCAAPAGTVTLVAEVRGEQYPITARCGLTPAEIEAGIAETSIVLDGEEFLGTTYLAADEAALSGPEPPVVADMVVLLSD